MQVIVRDRRQGKTTELVKWLLQGKIQDNYPYWSRVIVCYTNSMVHHTTRMVVRYMEEHNWEPIEPRHAYYDEGYIDRVRGDVRKAVWGFRDLGFNLVGNRDFEYALDDAEQDLFQGDRGWPLTRPPAIITLTGSLYDPVRD